MQVHAGHTEVEHVLANKLVQLGVRPVGRAAADRKHALDAIVAQTLAENALPHHPCRSEENHFHDSSITLYSAALAANVSTTAMFCSSS